MMLSSRAASGNTSLPARAQTELGKPHAVYSNAC